MHCIRLPHPSWFSETGQFRWCEMPRVLPRDYEISRRKRVIEQALRNLYGFKNIATKRIASAFDITKELSEGRIVIVPTAGRLLKNPHFTASGPLYHMLVIKGFDDAKHTFITNDPGTRREWVCL